MTRHFPPSPLGTAMIGDDQVEWLPQITWVSRSLLPSPSLSWQWGIPSARQVLSHLSQFAFCEMYCANTFLILHKL